MAIKETKEKELSIWKSILRSFDNKPDGFSARKLSAFVGMLGAIYCTIHYVDSSTVVHALGIWLIFVLLCLGIITAEQIVRFKHSADKEKDIEPAPTEEPASKPTGSDPVI